MKKDLAPTYCVRQVAPPITLEWTVTEVIFMIRKIKEGYRVMSENGRNMGTYKTLEEAKKRLRQIEFFKHKAKK